MADICDKCGQPLPEAPIERAGLFLHPNSGTVEFEGQKCTLTGQQFAIVEMIVRRGCVSRTDVMHEVFGDGLTVGKKILDVQVCKARTALAQIGAGGFIATNWGKGYQFDPTNSWVPSDRRGEKRK